ncbi:zf-HC2 domain-containing protein [Chloroflexia bacterium SDU3-3]|nr:zf-HC2 domain-containing protein [Chloroflexia bacterium SDU3-3]
MPCPDEGQLRAYLDSPQPSLERAALAAHIAECERCSRALGQLASAARAAEAYLTPAALPDADAALVRFRAAHMRPAEAARTSQGARPMFSRKQSGRTWPAIAAVVVAFALLLALPPVRAAAANLLQIFRVKQVVFVPITDERAEQLKSLNIDPENLFVSKPTTTGSSTPQTVGDLPAAAGAVGFTPAQPAALPAPAAQTSYKVWGQQSASFQVNVETARSVLGALNITSVSLPDALGQQPITVKVDPLVESTFSTSAYTVTLTQGRSPEVALPEGVNLADLGSAALQVLGTPADKATAMAQSIDWSSTLLVPFPAGVSQIQQVSIGESKGLLFAAYDSETGQQHGAVYWQHGSTFYVLAATGLNDNELMAVASSVR